MRFRPVLRPREWATVCIQRVYICVYAQFHLAVKSTPIGQAHCCAVSRFVCGLFANRLSAVCVSFTSICQFTAQRMDEVCAYISFVFGGVSFVCKAARHKHRGAIRVVVAVHHHGYWRRSHSSCFNPLPPLRTISFLLLHSLPFLDGWIGAGFLEHFYINNAKMT